MDGLTREAVVEALAGFAGEQMQRAPAFSAKHIDGERSHRLARRGADVAAPESMVRVHSIEALDWSSPSADVPRHRERRHLPPGDRPRSG